MRVRSTILTLIAGLLASISTAYSWGEEGHSIVAEIAQRRLNASASNMVTELLGPNSSLASMASWADSIRNRHPETANWHFIDIPRDSSEYVEARDCAESPGGDCIVKEIARVRSTLACSADLDAKRDALRLRFILWAIFTSRCTPSRNSAVATKSKYEARSGAPLVNRSASWAAWILRICT